MAESAVFSLAGKILSTIASPTFEKAYEKGVSIWEAEDELAKLKVTIETIQAVLLDAEKKQESSAVVKNWIKRLKRVLYDADDLFEEVATHDLLKQQMRKGNYKLSFKKKVRVSCVNLNPIVSRNSIAKKVKAIRKSLLEISSDMAGLGLVPCGKEEEVPNGLRRGQDPGCFVDADDVIGRDEDKKAILEMLLNESYDAKSGVSVVFIAIVGIGGMGKTTLAQLVYNDDEVKGKFEEKWFACISDISDEKEVTGKIFQSIYEENYSGFTISQLQTKIRQSIEGKKFVLVLDDVWEDNHDRWLKRMKLLSGGARGSRIIVTTRSSSVAAAVGALKTHELGGLSHDYSWDLFKRVAFAPGNENDTWRIDLGKEIVKKCRNVPLAIRSIGSLLFEKNTIQEWESIRGEELPKLGTHHEDGIMHVLKLSYDHLPSILKQCFAYCSLFPKDYMMSKQRLIYLWIAQGYIKENNEVEGHSHFMYLLRRGFFQEANKDAYGEIKSCNMHDLIHDLAQYVAGEESIMLTALPHESNCATPNESNCVRHVSSGDFIIDSSWAIPTSLLNVNGLRSFMLLNGSICNSRLLDQVFANFNWLRALWLPNLEIENVPISIGELKQLRYLDLSRNKFVSLPDSLTNLLNLRTLDIRECKELEALPEDLRKLINLSCLIIAGCDSLMHMPGGIGELKQLRYLDLSRNRFVSLPDSLTNLLNLRTLNLKECDELKALPEDLRKLINLRCLINKGCDSLTHMPGGIGEMSCLQYLSDFKVGKAVISGVKEGGRKRSGLVELSRLQHQLKGRLSIEFEFDVKFECGIDEEEIWDGDECRWQLPVSPHELLISRYPGKGIVDWGIDNNISISERTSNNLAVLEIRNCKKLKYLPPLRCLPNLRRLGLSILVGLEYVEEEDSESIHNNTSSSIFFPRLEELSLYVLPKVKGWWRRVASTPPQFPLLSKLELSCCRALELKSFPLRPHLRDVHLKGVDDNAAIQEQWPSMIFGCSSFVPLSSPASSFPPAIENITIRNCKWLGSFHDGGLASLRCLEFRRCSSLKSVHLESPHLQTIYISDCDELMSFEMQVEAPTTSLRSLHFVDNEQLKNLDIPAAHLNALEKLMIAWCPELKLWDSPYESRECLLDWDSLANLRELILDGIPPPEEIPICLQQRQALGQLTIVCQWYKPTSFDLVGENL